MYLFNDGSPWPKTCWCFYRKDFRTEYQCTVLKNNVQFNLLNIINRGLLSFNGCAYYFVCSEAVVLCFWLTTCMGNSIWTVLLCYMSKHDCCVFCPRHIKEMSDYVFQFFTWDVNIFCWVHNALHCLSTCNTGSV